jgi:hypothetical protein
MAHRESDYSTHRQSGQFVYVVPSSNVKVNAKLVSYGFNK